MVVIDPLLTLKLSFNTFKIVAKQFVVHEAFDTIKSSSFKVSSLTPKTMVLSTFFPGAEIRTFFAPAFKCFSALSLSVKSPVHSKTISISKLSQGKSTGSL